MTLEIFDGKKSLRFVGRKEDKESYDKIKSRLGFTYDIDFYTLCTAIGMNLDCRKKNLQKQELRTPKKMVGMETFTKKKFYDLLIYSYFDIEEDRLSTLETYFYTGFKIVENWFNNELIKSEYTLEMFSDIYNHILESKG